MARSVATSSAGAFPQFKGQLAALTRDVADALKPVAPLRDVWLPEFPEPGRSQSKAVRVFDREVALSVLRRIIAEPTMGQLLDAVRADKTLAVRLLVDAAGTPLDLASQSAFFMMPIGSFLADYLDDQAEGCAAWDEARFDRYYARFAGSVQRRRRSVIAVAALQQFSVELDLLPFLLSPSISLAEPDIQERLLKLGPIRVLHVPGECVTIGLPDGVLGSSGGQWFGGDDCRIDLRFLRQDARNLLEKIPELRATFAIALSRFEGLPRRMSLDDRLIDATIGLENLLLGGVSRGMTFRVALLCVALCCSAKVLPTGNVSLDSCRRYTRTDRRLYMERVKGAVTLPLMLVQLLRRALLAVGETTWDRTCLNQELRRLELRM